MQKVSSYKRIAITLTSLAAVLLFCVPAWAQTPGISGSVVDPSGAAIPGATVTIENPESNWRKSFLAGGDGSFAVLVPSPGNYQLQIQAPGFRPYVQTSLTVDGTAQLTLKAQLSLASVGTTVEVSAEALQIDLSSTQGGEAIAATEMTSTPLNGRSFTDLLALQAGVVPVSSQQPNAVQMSGCTSTSPSGDLNPGNMSVSGQRETANGFVLNGANVEETFNMGAAVVPNLDAIQEFRVITSNFDAQYGNFSGGQVLVTTKSGTNQIHGGVFEFLRNTALDARNTSLPIAQPTIKISLAERSAAQLRRTRCSSSPIIRELV